MIYRPVNVCLPHRVSANDLDCVTSQCLPSALRFPLAIVACAFVCLPCQSCLNERWLLVA